MVKQEQRTITIITTLLVLLCIYFIIDFYINRNSYYVEFTANLNPPQPILTEQEQNIDSETTAKIFARVQNK